MTYREYVLHQLREMRRELLTAVADLPEEAMLSFEPVGHWPAAWIAEHCTEVADKLLIKPVKGAYMLQYAEHVSKWPKRNPKPGDSYPPPAEIEERWKAVCDAALEFVEGLSDEGLNTEYDGKPYVQNVLLAVNHANSHLRSLWCILGEKRIDNKFAEQQDYLA